MKTTFITLLLISTLNQLNPSSEKDLIGKWMVEEVRIMYPSICIDPEIGDIIGMEMEFTEGHEFMFKTKNGRTIKHTWSIKEGSILIQYDKNKEPKKWKYNLKGNKLILNITNIGELTLSRK